MKQIVFVGGDDGYDETKLTTSHGDFIRRPSMVKAGEVSQVALGSVRKKTFGYKTDDGHFVVGDLRDPDTTAFDEYPVSGMNRAMVMHALREAGLNENHDVVLCSGLPIRRYYIDNAINQKLVKAKRANLLKNDVIALDGYNLPRIIDHTVSAEGISAWFDLALNRDDGGNLVMDEDVMSARIAVVDIGGRTTDVGLIDGGVLEMESSTTIDVGMLSIKSALREKIKSIHGAEPSIPKINEAIRTGKMKLFNEELSDVPDILNQISKSTVERIHGEVRRVLSDGADVDFVYFVGGTVAALSDYMSGWFKNQKMSSNPSMANSMGMAKLAEYSYMKKRQK